VLLGRLRCRGRFGRLWLTRTADCGTQASCLAGDGVARCYQRSTSQTAVTRVLAQCLAQRSGLNSSLEFGQPVTLSRRFAVHRVLESLYQLLEMSDAGLEAAKLIRFRGRCRWPRARRRLGHATELPDPGNQAFTLV
jgi:hypothetical protein